MELLEQHFDTAFTAPDGIKKLRELILTLAMQGKLVAQDPNDPPASQLLKEIEKKKSKLVTDGVIKSPKPLSEISSDEVPYALPLGWQWVRMGDITEIIRGITFPASEKTKDPALGRVACLRTTNVQKEIEWDDLLYIDESYVKKQSQMIRKHDIVMSMANSRELVGKVAIIREEPSSKVTFGGFLGVIRTYEVLPFFVLNLLTTNYARASLIDSASQTTNIANVSLGKLNPFLVPVPPLQEQHRIVAKIDQLMARCDELEKLRDEREQKRRSVHAAALKQLLDAQAGGSFADAWQFITQHFGELYAVRENVTELRKSILQLAVMGKLVPQNPNDPPASQLLKEIEAEKNRLVKEGKIKAPKALPEIKPDEVPYLLPQGWEWCRLQDILDVRDGTHDSPKDADGDDTYPLVTSKNFINGRIDFSDARRISAKDHFEIIKRSRVEKLDILFSMIGGNIGNQVIVEEDTEFSIKNVALFKYYNKNLTQPYFIKRFLEHLAVDLQQEAAGGAQPFVSLGFLRNLIIALPPKYEQQRIVVKIDSLMALCDALEQQIDASTRKQTALLDAVMAQV